MKKDISPEEFDRLLDEHFSNDANIKRGIKNVGSKNPEFKNTMKQVAAQRDETYHEKRRKGLEQRDNSYQAESNSRPEVQAKISASMKGKEKTAEHLAKVAAKNRERCKPIQTPYGQFPSRKAAAEHMTSIGIGNAGKKLDKYLRTDKENYFYIKQ